MAAERIAPIDVWELARGRETRQGDIDVHRMPRLAGQLVDAADRLRFRFTGAIDERGRPAARLELDGTMHAVCDRCGQPVAVPISERAQFYFVAAEEDLARLPIDETSEEALLGSQRFDLAALIEDQAILALPISPRHDRCAAAARDEGARAPEEGTQRPFLALAGLKKKDGH